MTITAHTAFATIQKHFGTSSTIGLARLMMAMHNSDTAFNFCRDLRGLDDTNEALARRLIAEYFDGNYRDGDFSPLSHWLSRGKDGQFDAKAYRRWCRASFKSML